MIVSPTKVGYIIMAADYRGLERKFASKGRRRNKPAVVLCGSMEQLDMLAELDDRIRAFYRCHWEADILLGCILPWRKSGLTFIPDDGSETLVRDSRGTSCFVIRFGRPSESIVRDLWESDRRLVFASSANPSGQGNKGRVSGIGERIATEADLVIEADDYVASIQPDKDEVSRYEQGVMVSFVDENGRLLENHEERGPMFIRKGLAMDFIMMALANHFDSWDFRHGAYY